MIILIPLKITQMYKNQQPKVSKNGQNKQANANGPYFKFKGEWV